MLGFYFALTSCGSDGNLSEESTQDSTNVNLTEVEKQLTSTEIADLMLNSTVAITIQDNFKQTLKLGSGYMYNDYIITNYHVIADGKFGFVETNSKVQFRIIGFVATDVEMDLALLELEKNDIPNLNLNCEINNLQTGDKIYVSGNPHGLSGTFTDGLISSIRQLNNRDYIQISAPISPGSSGGPVADEDGNIIGTAVGSYEDGQNLNFAIPSSFAKSLMDKKGEVQPLSDATSLGIADREKENKSNLQAELNAGIELRNLIWNEKGMSAFTNSDFHRMANDLVEVSIYNKFEYPISNIKVLAIVYDNTGTPVDYNVSTFDVYIEPLLAKTISGGVLSGLLGIDKKKGYSCEIRILDFTIHK